MRWFLLFLLSVFLTTDRRVNCKLVFLQSVCRHGDRAPLYLYPHYQNEEKWTLGLGRLTEKGIEQCYRNGQLYRSHYDGLMSETYKEDELKIYSSRIERAITSAQSFASGFLNSSGYFPKEMSYKYYPYPVHSIPEENDHFLSVSGLHCEQLSDALADFMNSDKFTLLGAQHQSFINQVCEKAGYKMDYWNMTSIRHMVDTTSCDKFHQMKLPSWLDEETWQNMTHIMEQYRVLFLSDKNLIRNFDGGGSFIHLILDNIRAYINGSSQATKFILFYAHDTTLLGFLAHLNYNNLRSNPQYTACINIELHNDGGKFSVDIQYKNETDSMNMHRVVPKGCPADKSCNWNSFEAAMLPLEVSNAQLSCSPTDVILRLTLTTSNLVVLIIATSIALMTLLILVYACGKNRDSTKVGRMNIPYEPLEFMHDI